jgi:hypothetical protein
MRNFKIALVTVLFLIIAANSSFAQEHQKSSWYIGFGLGSGQAKFEGDKAFENADSKSPKITFNFGVGAILNPNIHLGFDVSAWRQEAEYDYYNQTISYQINNYMLALTFFPMETGLALKAGVGACVFVYNNDYDGGSTAESYSGKAFLFGVAYHFWLGETFNLGLNLEYSKQYYNDDEVFDDTDFWNAYVSFYWF